MDYLEGIKTPLSLSLPVIQHMYSDEDIFPYILGLLPDNPNKLRELEMKMKVQSGNLFGLMKEIGIDCPGAVSFIDDIHNDAIQSKLTQQSVDDIAQSLKKIRENAGAVVENADENYSLGGFQSKFALRKIGERWYKASGLEPTTHIFKPGLRPNDFQDQALIEHLCTKLARAVGLDAQETEFCDFNGEPTVILTRFDRYNEDGEVKKRHQEDFCQAMNIIPSRKYERDGGPGIRQMFQLLDKWGQHYKERQENKQKLLDGILFNYLILGSDAHAKNYSVFLDQDSVILTPLYDVASFAPYYDDDLTNHQYALKIGESRYYRKLDDNDLSILSEETGLKYEYIRERLDLLSTMILDKLPKVCREYQNIKTVQLLVERVSCHPELVSRSYSQFGN
jgi:serine/threonine-protein kinase HipA